MKCNTCKIYKEMPDGACCIWYMDNVVCGDKTSEDCPEYIPCNAKKKPDFTNHDGSHDYD